MKILVADDEIVSRRLVQRLLQGWGHEVTVAADGAEAWKYYDKEHFPLVISDWMMPEMDGVELVRRIRAREGYGYTYIILLTAKSAKEELTEGMDAGADDFISKPFDATELKSRLRAGERVLRLEQNLEQRNRELEQANQEVALANHRMKNDLEAAAKIQRNLLPKSFPDEPSFRFDFNYQPCDELAGDILNVFRLDDRNIAFYVLDVSGHGVPSALLSVTLHHALSPMMDQSNLLKRPIAEAPGYAIVPPPEVAATLNRQYPMEERGGLYFTLLYGIVNADTRQVRYVQAGHPSPILVPPQGDARILPGSGFPIGLFDEATYEEKALTLEPGERLYLYSDGLYEIMNSQNEQFEQWRVAQAFGEKRSAPLAEGFSYVVNQANEWGGGRLIDDISLLALEVRA